MKTEAEVQAKIQEIEKQYARVLEGQLATIFENAPRALMQLEASGWLSALSWVLGKTWTPPYKEAAERVRTQRKRTKP